MSVDIGWVAGVLDVRGYLSDRPSSHADRRLPTIAVTMPAVDGSPNPVIARLCDLTGVAPIETGKGYNRHACGEHCPTPHSHVRGTYHRWIIGGGKAVTVLQACLPRLVARRADAEALLRMGEARAYKHAHLADMKARGWPIHAAGGVE